jgi:Rieske Fe-S protein
MPHPTGSRHTQPDSEVTRRAVVVGTGVLTVAAALAACSSNENQGAAPPSEAPPEPAPAAHGGERLASTGDIPVGGGTVFASQRVVVTQPTPGTFEAFSAICTHQGCTVNKVASGTIDCSCHGSKFAIADGSVVHGPASRPLPRRQVTVAGDALLLE